MTPPHNRSRPSPAWKKPWIPLAAIAAGATAPIPNKNRQLCTARSPGYNTCHPIVLVAHGRLTRQIDRNLRPTRRLVLISQGSARYDANTVRLPVPVTRYASRLLYERINVRKSATSTFPTPVTYTTVVRSSAPSNSNSVFIFSQMSPAVVFVARDPGYPPSRLHRSRCLPSGSPSGPHCLPPAARSVPRRTHGTALESSSSKEKTAPGLLRYSPSSMAPNPVPSITFTTLYGLA